MPEIGRCVDGEKVKTIDAIDNVPILSWESESIYQFKPIGN